MNGNHFKIPIVPQWNRTHGCVCTPDGGFLYVGARNINYIGKIVADKVPEVKEFHTRQSIESLDIDPAWGNQHGEDAIAGTRRFAVLAQDNSVQIWDFDKGCAVSGHKAHFNLTRYLEGQAPSVHNPDRILISYMSNSNVLSVSSMHLVVYCVASNSFCRRSSFLPSSNQLWTVLRCSPYNEHHFAVGSNRGLVLLCDLQKLSVLYKCRGHDTAISSLAWNVVAVEGMSEKRISAHKPEEFAKKKRDASIGVAASGGVPARAAVAGSSDDIFDIYDYDYLENEFGAPADSNKARTAAMAEFVGASKSLEAAPAVQFDFVEACQSLKQDMDARQVPEAAPPAYEDAVTLAECKQVQHYDNTSLSCSSNDDASVASLELLERSSSDDIASPDGAGTSERKPKQQVLLHQAEVHAAQPLEQSKSGEPTTAAHRPPLCETVTDILLASASIDSTFCIWHTESGRHCDTVRSSSGSHGKNFQVEVAWLNANKLLTNNKQGDLTLWSLQPPAPADKSAAASARQPRVYKLLAEKSTFTQHCVVAFSTNAELLWSIATTREIVCEDTSTRQVLGKYGCASTNIIAMRECPDNMNKIAVGFSDHRVGIVDIAKLSPNMITIDNYHQRVDSSVYALVWSPDSTRLAFGTVDGRVGIITVDNPKQQTLTYNSIAGKPIYCLDWQANNIFAVCNELVGIYDAEGKKKDAYVIPKLGQVTSMSVRKEFMFVGTKHGNVQVYRHQHVAAAAATPATWTLELVHDLKLATRYITELAWSPIGVGHLAVAANDRNIAVLFFDFDTGALTEKRRIKIKTSKAATSCIKWSNRSENLLLTSGLDGGMRVWDWTAIADEEKYLKQYHCPMSCGLFLPNDEEIFLCAGKSTSMEFVNMRLQCSEDYSSTKLLRSTGSNALDNVQWATRTMLQSDCKPGEKRRNRKNFAGVIDACLGLDGTDATEALKCAAGHGNAIVGVVELTGAGQKNAVVRDKEQIAALMSNLKIMEAEKRALTKNKCSENCGAIYLKSPSTLLHLTTKELNRNSLDQLATLLSAKPNVFKEHSLCIKLFGTKAQAQQLLQEELKNYQHNETKGISSLFMTQLVGGGFKTEIVQAIQSRSLSAWHVAMSPSISYSFWQKCCEAYADQLLAQNCVLQAVTYLLALHKQREAIDILVERQFYKEALLIGRIYLKSNDPLIATIENKWISYMEQTGNLAAAAWLCVLTGQLDRANESLTKWRSPPAEVERVLQLLNAKMATVETGTH